MVFNGSTTSSRLVSKLADRTPRTPLRTLKFWRRKSGFRTLANYCWKARNKGNAWSLEFPVRVSVGECLFKFLLAFPSPLFFSFPFDLISTCEMYSFRDVFSNKCDDDRRKSSDTKDFYFSRVTWYKRREFRFVTSFFRKLSGKIGDDGSDQVQTVIRKTVVRIF